MKSGDLLFVYGSLRRGEQADLSLRPGVTFLNTDAINGELYAVGWYPGAKAVPSGFDHHNPSIVGDVFRIEDDAIAPLLDAYECYPSLFNRIETMTAAGHKVWVYTYNNVVDESRRVDNGDWSTRQRNEMSLPFGG